MRLDGGLRLGPHALVGFEHRVGHRPLALAVEARRGDVHAALADAGGDVGEHAGLVALPHDHARALAGDAHVDAVDAPDDRRAAAHALAAHGHLVAGGVDHADVDGVGVLVVRRVGQGREGKREPGLFGQGERIADAQVIGRKSQHARHERLVSAVSGKRVRERPQKRELDAHGLGQTQAARHGGYAQRARRVRTRGPHHDGPDDVGQSERFHVVLLRCLVVRAGPS